ncbi:four-helix bundle copper-binding protein [Bdellovibrio sp. HCB337]|uniref:four-helix bundle copper-binding protein n=1 Tax=Bdellovibrio sp. HCB337 TaxID=3394358 RepID=UPI0039A723B8
MATRDPMQDSDLAHCIKNCFACHRVCLETLHHCLSQKSTHFQGKNLELLQMCAESCLLSARMMVADLEFHHQSCELCFEVCLACADECERFTEDPEMLRCADVCRTCAESCRAMAGMTVKVSASERVQRPRGTVQ